MRSLFAAIPLAFVLCSIMVLPAEAKRHSVKSQKTKTVIIVKADEKLKNDMAELRRELAFFRELARGPSVLGTIPLGLLEPVIVPSIQVASIGPTNVVIETPKDLSLRGVVTNGLPPALKDVLRKVQDTCDGFRVISACRPGARVRGSGRVSLHASCRAADFTVASYPCAFKVLAKTPCGYSTDPGRVRHIHTSCSKGTGEYGRHFAHWQPGHRRYARRNHRNFVRA